MFFCEYQGLLDQELFDAAWGVVPGLRALGRSRSLETRSFQVSQLDLPSCVEHDNLMRDTASRNGFAYLDVVTYT